MNRINQYKQFPLLASAFIELAVLLIILPSKLTIASAQITTPTATPAPTTTPGPSATPTLKTTPAPTTTPAPVIQPTPTATPAPVTTPATTPAPTVTPAPVTTPGPSATPTPITTPAPTTTPAPVTTPNSNSNNLNNAMCITGNSLPASGQFQVLGSIKKKSITYGSANDLWPKLAEEAKGMGANAIVQAKDYQGVDWFAWSAPRVAGLAVRIEDLTLLDKLECQWY